MRNRKFYHKILDSIGEWLEILTPTVLLMLIVVGCGFGWVNNIVLLALHHSDMVMVALRIIGIIAWPLGIILGYINV